MACVCVCRGAFLPPVALTQPCLPRSRPQPRPTFESYGATSSPSHVWLSPLTTWPSFLLPRTAPLLSVSGCLGGGPAPRAHARGLVWEEGVIRANCGPTGKLPEAGLLPKKCCLGGMEASLQQ